ncbi:DUF1007 family protein [Xanthobacter sp. TB0139]|uniref:DUF1007 family protein n=1 Tax=Xanthobacter sp. TB0139 TaxID=3459178 RepID=UPI00403A4EFD
MWRRLFLHLGAWALVAGLVTGSPRPAAAHPHVWVVMRSELVYAPNGTLTGIRQSWTFDEAFSAFALQGLAKQADGTYGDDVLKPLAELNISSLKEFEYFVTAKTATSKIPLKDPVNYYLTYADDALTLHFTLPLTRPLSAHGMVSIDIYDPTYFIAFEFSPTRPVKLLDAPAGCAEKVMSPAKQQTTQLSEAFFENLTQASSFSMQMADKIVVKCP